MARKSKDEDDEVWSAEEEEEDEENDEDSESDYEPEKNSKKKNTPISKKKRKETVEVKEKVPKRKATNSRQKTGSSSSNISTTMAVNSEYMEDIKLVFSKFDTENIGKIQTSKLKFAMRALGFEPKSQEVKRISESYDKDGFIDYKDFVDLLVKRFTEKNVSEEIMKAFQLFDKDHTGKITLADLQRVSDELGEKISSEELKEMIEEADLNGDSVVDEQEFLRIMKKTSLY